MGSLSSSSTTAVVEAQYDDNACYEADASTAKCKLFLEAAIILRRRVPRSSAGDGGGVTEHDYTTEIAEARAWLLAHDADSRAGPDATQVAFRDFRYR